MQPTTELTPIQLTFLDWVIKGLSVEDAAKSTELRWSTIVQWSRTMPEFRLALDEAFEYRAMLYRERAQDLCYEAVQAVLQVIRDPKASPSVRLRASLTIIKMSTAPRTETTSKSQPKQQIKPENVHKSAQSHPIRSTTSGAKLTDDAEPAAA